MHRFFYVWSFMTVLSFILALLSFHSFTYAQSAEMTAIQGAVLDENDEALGGVVVRLNTDSVADTTDALGRFDFERVPWGTYVLTARKPGSSYLSATKRIVVSENTPGVLMIQLRHRVYASDEVVVISTPLSREERIENEPAQVDVVTRAEFERNAVTVEDVIASTPSATITSYGGLGSFSEVSLRGSYSNQVQVYLDGMLLNEANGGAVNLGLVSLANVERVETWRSGAPARFGGDAVGGAINIVTRDHRTNSGSVSLGYGSFGTMTGYGVAGFGTPESHVLVSLDSAASRNDFDYTSDNGTPQNPDDDYTTHRRDNEFRTINGLIKYRRLMGTSLSFELSEHILHSKKDLPSTQHILHSGASLSTTKNLLQSRLTWVPGSLQWLEVTPTVHSILSREHYRDTEGHVGWGEQDNEYETTTIKGMLPVSMRCGTFGEVTLTPVTAHESYNPEHRLENTVPLSSDREHLGLVGDLSLHTPGRRVQMTVNVRRDRYFSDYEGQANLFNPLPPESQFHHVTNAQTGIKIEVNPLMTLRWNYGDNWRVPSFYELFGDRGGVVSQPGLQPEHVYRWDAGARFHVPASWERFGGRFDVVYFENNYRNLIQWYTTNYGFIEPANVPGSYVKGTELVWNTRLLDAVDVRGNWTFQDSEVTATSKVYHLGKLLPNRPDNYGTCTLEYAYRRVSLFWTIDHKDSYFLDRSNQPHKKYPGRTLHNAGLSFGIRHNTIVWRFIAENIADEKTFDIQGMPKPGRSFMINVSYSP